MKGKLLLLSAATCFVMAGTASAAFIRGTSGDDAIVGTPTADVIYAKAGDDKVRGGDGADFIDAGPGNDVVHGGSGADMIYGGDGNDVLYGGRGADRLYGGRGDDTLYALANDNQRDYLDCGPGNDTAWVNVAERGLYRIENCETVNWIVPTPEQATDEAQN